MSAKIKEPNNQANSVKDPQTFTNLTAMDNSMSTYIAIAVIGLTFLVFLFAILLKRGKKGRAILICGPSDSGKSLLFSQLVHRKKIDTFTSMQENLGLLDLTDTRKKPVDVMDLPGHDRLRTKCLEKHKSSALGIVYVLDASTITKNIRDVTEFLFQILSDPTIHGNRTSVLIVCNKQDMTLAKGSSVIERELAKEIGLLRETHSKSLQGTDGNVINHVFLGKIGKDFAFSDLKAKVDFCEISALEDDNIDKVKEWISTTA